MTTQHPPARRPPAGRRLDMSDERTRNEVREGSISFVVPGPPIPKARARVTRMGHGYTPESTVLYARKVQMCARTAGIRQPLTGPVSLSCCFYMPTARLPDVDNLAKAVMDALQGIAYVNDSQVAPLYANRMIDRANPRAVVTVEPSR